MDPCPVAIHYQLETPCSRCVPYFKIGKINWTVWTGHLTRPICVPLCRMSPACLLWIQPIRCASASSRLCESTRDGREREQTNKQRLCLELRYCCYLLVFSQEYGVTYKIDPWRHWAIYQRVLSYLKC